jgi:hypothetical protein
MLVSEKDRRIDRRAIDIKLAKPREENIFDGKVGSVRRAVKKLSVPIRQDRPRLEDVSENDRRIDRRSSRQVGQKIRRRSFRRECRFRRAGG